MNAFSAVNNALRFAFASLCFDRAWNLMKFGIAIAARMPMIATTIISSIRVKPFCRHRRFGTFARMRWLLVAALLALPAMAGEHNVALIPIEGVLSRGDAIALEEMVRSEARELHVAVVPGTETSIAAAAEQGANAAITGKAVRLEGALAVTLTLVKAGDGTRLATERL